MSVATAPNVDADFAEEWRQMTLDEAIEVAHRETGISYQKDDPVLAVVAILNAFGDRLKSLLEDERKRVSFQFQNDVSGVNEAIDHKVDDIANTIQKVARNLGNDNIQTVVSAVAQHAVESDKITRTIRRAFYGFSALAFTNWMAVAAFYLILK
jgi:Icc-related predicted phosphoesterase